MRAPVAPRATVAGMVGVIVGTLGLSVIPAPASAYAGTAVRTSLPASVLAAVTGIDTPPATRVSMTAATVRTSVDGTTRIPVGTSTAARGLTRAAGPVGVAVGGLTLGYTIGSGAMRLAGYDTDGQIGELLGIEPAPGYVPDFDVIPPAVGWVGNPTGQFEEPLFGGGTYVGTITYSTSDEAYYTVGDGGRFRVMDVLAQVQQELNYNTAATVRSRCQDGTIGSQAQAQTRPADGVRRMEVSCDRQEISRVEVFRSANGSMELLATFHTIHSPDRPPAETASPQRFWEMRTRCADGSGNVTASAGFHETDARWPSPPDPACGVGAGIPTGWDLWQIVPDAPELNHLFDSWTIPDVLRDWLASNPGWETDPQGTVTLVDVGASPEVDCFGDAARCADWFTDPAKGEKYQCRYGTQVLALSECNHYRPTFARASGRSSVDSQGRTVTTPAPYGDPANEGNPVPDPNPRADPTPGPGPTPGGGDADRECPPRVTVESFISGRVIHDAVSCALTTLFVPSPPTALRMRQLGEAAAGKTPWPQLAAFGGWVQPPDLRTRCLTVTLPLKWVIRQDLVVLDTCNPQDPVVKFIGPLRPLLTIVIWVSFIAPLAWWAWREYAPGAKGVA